MPSACGELLLALKAVPGRTARYARAVTHLRPRQPSRWRYLGWSCPSSPGSGPTSSTSVGPAYAQPMTETPFVPPALGKPAAIFNVARVRYGGDRDLGWDPEPGALSASVFRAAEVSQGVALG